MPPIIRRPQRITAVFDEIEVVLLRDGGHCVEIERVPKRMRQDDRSRFSSNGRCQALNIDVGRFKIDIDKDWYAPILDNWCNGRRKSSGNRNYLAAGFDPTPVEFPGGQGRKCKQVGRRSGYG